MGVVRRPLPRASFTSNALQSAPASGGSESTGGGRPGPALLARLKPGMVLSHVRSLFEERALLASAGRFDWTEYWFGICQPAEVVTGPNDAVRRGRTRVIHPASRFNIGPPLPRPQLRRSTDWRPARKVGPGSEAMGPGAGWGRRVMRREGWSRPAPRCAARGTDRGGRRRGGEGGEGEMGRAGRDDGGVSGAAGVLCADGAGAALLLAHRRPLLPLPHGPRPRRAAATEPPRSSTSPTPSPHPALPRPTQSGGGCLRPGRRLRAAQVAAARAGLGGGGGLRAPSWCVRCPPSERERGRLAVAGPGGPGLRPRLRVGVGRGSAVSALAHAPARSRALS